MGTFLVNIIGCFLIGLFFGLLEKAHVMTPGENVLLITGFCGGFTTFSSFADVSVGGGAPPGRHNPKKNPTTRGGRAPPGPPPRLRSVLLLQCLKK